MNFPGRPICQTCAGTARSFPAPMVCTEHDTTEAPECWSIAGSRPKAAARLEGQEGGEQDMTNPVLRCARPDQRNRTAESAATTSPASATHHRADSHLAVAARLRRNRSAAEPPRPATGTTARPSPAATTGLTSATHRRAHSHLAVAARLRRNRSAAERQILATAPPRGRAPQPPPAPPRQRTTGQTPTSPSLPARSPTETVPSETLPGGNVPICDQVACDRGPGYRVARTRCKVSSPACFQVILPPAQPISPAWPTCSSPNARWIAQPRARRIIASSASG